MADNLDFIFFVHIEQENHEYFITKDQQTLDDYLKVVHNPKFLGWPRFQFPADASDGRYSDLTNHKPQIQDAFSSRTSFYAVANRGKFHIEMR